MIKKTQQIKKRQAPTRKNVPKNNRQKSGPRKAPRQSPRMTVRATNVPMEVAYSYQNTARDTVHVERGCDRLGYITVPAGGTPGTVLGKFMMNPINFPNTRMFAICKAYQHYRIRRAIFTIFPTISTSTSGALISAYVANPDMSLGNQPQTTLFAANGRATSLYVRSDIAMRASDPKWYVIDPDSEEIMNTTQGFYAVVLDQQTTLSSAVSIPVVCEYEMEFKTPAANAVSYGAMSTLTSGTWTSNGNSYTTTATISPALTSGLLYLFQPAQNFVYSADGVSTSVQFLFYNGSGLYNLYETMQDFLQSKPIITPNTTAVPLGGGTLFVMSGN